MFFHAFSIAVCNFEVEFVHASFIKIRQIVINRQFFLEKKNHFDLHLSMIMTFLSILTNSLSLVTLLKTVIENVTIKSTGSCDRYWDLDFWYQPSAIKCHCHAYVEKKLTIRSDSILLAKGNPSYSLGFSWLLSFLSIHQCWYGSPFSIKKDKLRGLIWQFADPFQKNLTCLAGVLKVNCIEIKKSLWIPHFDINAIWHGINTARIDYG